MWDVTVADIDPDITHYIFGEFGWVPPLDTPKHVEMPPTPRSMSGDNANVLHMVDWGNRLSLALYDFSTIHTSVARDLTAVAKQLTLLANVLRQTGATIKEELSIASTEAFQAMTDVLGQCQQIFLGIESLVPVWGRDKEKSLRRGSEFDDNGDWICDDLLLQKLMCFLGMLEGLQLTLSVLVQTIYTTKTIVWARQTQPRPIHDYVGPERMQLETLVMEQQLAIIRAVRQYQEYTQLRAASTQATTLAIVQQEQNSPNPQALVVYQEPMLVDVHPAQTETEDLLRVRRVVSPYTDSLLTRWTRLQELEQRVHFMPKRPPDRKMLPPAMDGRRRSQQPTVESEDDDDAPLSQRHSPSLGFNSAGPVLMHVDEKTYDEPLAPTKTAMPGSPPASARPIDRRLPRSYSSSLPTNPFATDSFSGPANSNRLHPGGYTKAQSPNVSPIASPRNSFSSIASDVAPRTMHRLEVKPLVADVAGAVSEEDERLGIPWRIRLRDRYWDLKDSKVIRSSHSVPLTLEDIDDRATATEIMENWVSRQAIEEHRHEYTRVQKPMEDGQKTKLETCYRIHRGLHFPEVEKLVRRTVELYRRDHEDKTRRNDQGARRQPPSSMPPLDRSRTAPIPIVPPLDIPPYDAQYPHYLNQHSPRHPVEVHNPPQYRTYLAPTSTNSQQHLHPQRPTRRQSDHPASTTTTHTRSPLSSSFESESEAERRMRAQAQRSRRESRASRTSDRSREERFRDEGRGGRPRRGSGSMSTKSIVGGILGGAGVMALLEGLPDALGAL